MAAKDKNKKGKRARGPSKRNAAGVDLQAVKALAHELRVEILSILNERMASPNELSKELDEGLSQVSYHVKVLKDYGCITQVKTVPRRGAVEHYYRATSRPYINRRDWEKLPESVRESMSGHTMEMVIDDVAAALEAGTVDAHKDRHMSRTPLRLDARGLKDVGKILEDSLSRIAEVQEECGTRLSGAADDDGIDVMVAMMGIEVPAAKPRRAKPKRAKAKRK